MDSNRLSNLTHIKSFSSSFARLKVFRQNRITANSILAVEIRAVEIHRVNLRGQIVREFSPIEIAAYRPMIENKIYDLIKQKLHEIIEDPRVIEGMIKNTNSSEFNDLFQLHS